MRKSKEARTKWCPMKPKTDRGLGQSCLADECMAWRWDPDQPIGEYDSQHFQKYPENRKGYCGLAGKP